MCNQRERLIGFIYNEGDAAELREVKLHLEECPECRTEIGALRNVRDDLLAWDVPQAESVWRPFQPPAPVAQIAWWRQVPAWTLAAAASVVLLSGFAGGAVAHRFGQEAVVTSGPTGPATQTTTAVSLADLDARETRLRAELRALVGELDARVLRVSNVAPDLRAELRTAVADLNARVAKASTFTADSDDHATLQAEIVTLRDLNAKLVQLVNGFDAEWERLWKTLEMNNVAVGDKVRNLQQAVQQIAQSK